MIAHLIGKSVLFVVTRLMLLLTSLTTLVILLVMIVITLELYHTSIYLSMIVLHIGTNVLYVIKWKDTLMYTLLLAKMVLATILVQIATILNQKLHTISIITKRWTPWI